LLIKFTKKNQTNCNPAAFFKLGLLLEHAVKRDL